MILFQRLERVSASARCAGLARSACRTASESQLNKSTGAQAVKRLAACAKTPVDDIHRNPPRLIFGEQCGCRSPSRTLRARPYPYPLPPFPKFGSRSLHAATIRGSICGTAVACCVGVPSMIGRIQSDMIPRPLLAPLGTKPARVHACAILAQGCQGTG